MTMNFDTKRRAELPPLSVRLSPAEREMCRQKAAAKQVGQSELMRLALAAYDVNIAEQTSRSAQTCHVETRAQRELAVEYDPVEAPHAG